MQKLYAYVDESGQDTKGAVFFVSVVIIEQDREPLTKLLQTIEHESGKNRRKWSKTIPDRRYAYIKAVLREPSFRGKFYFSEARDTTNYVQITVKTTAQAIMLHAPKEYKATVIVDGLSKPEERAFAVGLRQRRIRTEKIRGATDEADIFLRLADAVCGFIREALGEKVDELRPLFNRAVKDGYIVSV